MARLTDRARAALLYLHSARTERSRRDFADAGHGPQVRRLERAGLIEQGPDDQGRPAYRLTPAGRAAVANAAPIVPDTAHKARATDAGPVDRTNAAQAAEDILREAGYRLAICARSNLSAGRRAELAYWTGPAGPRILQLTWNGPALEGWDVFAPVHNGNSVPATLEALKASVKPEQT